MSEEEIEAVKELRMMKEINLSFTSYAWCNGNVRLSEGQKHTIDTILNLIKKQQQELQLKDKKIATLKVLNEELKYEFESYKNNKDINYLDGTHHKNLVEKSLGQIIDKPEECWFDAIEVKVIWDGTLYNISSNSKEDFVNLKQIADKFGNKCITVIAESPLSGAIYRYNNYGEKEWQLIGIMYGYA